MPDLVKPSRALISVTDKSRLEELGAQLTSKGIEILSTGGSAKHMRAAQIPVTDVSEITQHPEIMNGRVKTLHPRIHGGILARRENPDHLDAAKTHGVSLIDIVVVNLYPFEKTVAATNNRSQIIENIDIGGPAMIRAAAKNHDDVTIITDAEDYLELIEELERNNGQISFNFRQQMAEIAFARTAAYDAAISEWFQDSLSIKFPRRKVKAATRAETLRYGENPHQEAAYYATSNDGFSVANIAQGKALSYNNINDADAAIALAAEFETPACAIIKHANPCGVASHSNLLNAYQNALAGDPTSAFGGIVAVNREIGADLAEEILKVFTEVVIAPSLSADAVQIFAQKPNIRVITMDFFGAPITTREVSGGWLVQDSDNSPEPYDEFEVVTKRTPTSDEMRDLLFAWKVAKHTKSNAIIYAKNESTVGIGAGQMSRVDSARIASRKALDMEESKNRGVSTAQRSVVASDAFFPFADGLLQAAESGATAVIQPGGSMRDSEVIDAANRAGLAMIFTGRRHFRH